MDGWRLDGIKDYYTYNLGNSGGATLFSKKYSFLMSLRF